jgi:hypothetical protein
MRIELLYDGEVIDVFDFWTNGKGKAEIYEIFDYDSFTDGTYTFRVTYVDDESITDSVSVEYEKPVFAEPVITVSMDKDTYNYYEDFTATVTLKNEDGTTENLGWLVPFYGYVYAVNPDGSEWHLGSFDFYSDNGFTFTVEGKFDIPVDYGYEGECTAIVYLRPFYSNDWFTGTTTVNYTSKLVPCEGEHDFEYVDAWYEGHFKRCRVCGLETEMEEHVYPDEWEIDYFGDEEPYCYDTVKYCTVCGGGEIYDGEAVHNHDKLERIVSCDDPTCETGGRYRAYTRCNNCGWTFDYEFTELPPLGHDFVNGVCTRCGEVQGCIATLTLDKAKAGENELITAVYTLKDKDGNPIAKAKVTPYCTLYGYYATSAMGGDVTTDENGQATFYIRPQRIEGIDLWMDPGDYYLSVEADDYEGSYAVQPFEFEDRTVDLGEYTVILEMSETLIGFNQVTLYNCSVTDKDGNPMPAMIVHYHTYFDQGKDQFSYWWITRGNGVAAMGIYFTEEEEEAKVGIYKVEAEVGKVTGRAYYTFSPDGSFVPGDITGDGVTNNKDVVALFKYVSGADVDISVPALDITGDGAVNNKDVVALFKYVSGGDIELSDTPYTPAA